MRYLILFLLTLATPVTGQTKPADHQTIASVSAVPNAGDFGVGLTLGTIIAANGKYWLTDQGALDFGIGFVGQPWTVVYADYLRHIPRIFGTGTKFGRESSLYLGGGGGLGFWNGRGTCGHWSCDWNSQTSDSGVGLFIRGLAGVEWYPARTRFGVFGELGPSIMLIPGTWGTLDVDIGGRYYF